MSAIDTTKAKKGYSDPAAVYAQARTGAAPYPPSGAPAQSNDAPLFADTPSAAAPQHPSQQIAKSLGQGYDDVELVVPLTFAWTPSSQQFPVQTPLVKPLQAKLGDKYSDQIVVQSAHVMHTHNTTPVPMVLNLTGVSAKDEHVVAGADIEGQAHTFIVPAGTQTYGADGRPIYVRQANELSAADFADNMAVDVNELSQAVAPYYGKGGAMADTHVEVLKNRSPALYNMVAQSPVSTKFSINSDDNPGFALSREDHERLVSAYKAKGGYKRTSRIDANDHTATLRHYGSKDTNNASSFLSSAPGLSEKVRRQAAEQSHRVMAEVRYRIAYPHKKK